MDPEILKMRKKHHEEIQRFLQTRDSEKRLQRIIEKELPRLTRDDQFKLYEHLKLKVIELSEADKVSLPGTEEGGTATEPAQGPGETPWPSE